MPFLLRRRAHSLTSAVAAVAVLSLASPAFAQWVGYPTAGVPRKADGSVDMTAPAPRMADGKPDFSGIWVPAKQTGEDVPSDGTDVGSSHYMANLGDRKSTRLNSSH